MSDSSASGGLGGKGGTDGHVLIEDDSAITARSEAALVIQAISVCNGADAYAVALPA